MGGFQTRVQNFPAPGVEGDFASANPRSTTLAGPGGLVCGPVGVFVGRFAWIEPDMKTTNNFGSGPAAPDGFVHRDQQGLLTQYLEVASLLVPAGFPITLHNGGDFWARNLGPAALTKGATVYAGYADGGIYSSAPAGASVTATLGSTNTASLGATFTAAASVASNELVITAVTGVISIGDTVNGSGITDAPQITAQLSGTTGGAGTYQLNNPETCTGGTVTSFGDVINVTAVSTYISIGDTVSHANYPSGATIAAQLSGTLGGVGVYQLSAPGTEYVASAAAVLTYGITFKATAIGSGVLAPGQPITDSTTAANVATGAAILAQINGAPGGIGVYTLNLSSAGGGGTYAAGDTLVASGGIDSGWKCYPTSPGDGAVGSLVKISKNVI